jgi:hypothetical protein
VSVSSCKIIYTTTNERKQKMAKTPKIGDTFTTAQSKVSGVVKEVVKNPSGSVRVRLDVEGETRWTTIK